MYKGKKLLVLGGKPIGSTELVARAKQLGLYVIVADFLPVDQSPAKLLADEYWDISTAEVDEIARLCKEHNVDGVLTAVHEFNINRMLDVCDLIDKPCYCKRDTWIYCDNKVAFKKLCMLNDIPVAKKYEVNIDDCASLNEIDYPVITKPVDGSGSRGFSICNNSDELVVGYYNALQYSPSKEILVEDFIPFDAVIIHYTMVHGKCHYSGISDKVSCKFKSTGASVMGFQSFPSKGEDIYLKTLDRKVRLMFEGAGFTDGPIWIEAFYDGKDKFVFNEMGYRFGGSLTYYPVRYFYGADQLDFIIACSLGETVVPTFTRNPQTKKYCILPIQIQSGIIEKIEGVDEVKSLESVNAFVPVHYAGDSIQEWGSAQQVFCYMHILYDNGDELRNSIVDILSKLKAIDSTGRNMLYTLFDINTL